MFCNLYLVRLQYRIVVGCCLRREMEVANLQIRGKERKRKSLFSLTPRRLSLDNSTEVQSRAKPPICPRPPPYFHLTSTCQESSVSPHAAVAFTKIRPTVVQHQSPYDGLAFRACRTWPSHRVDCSQRLGKCSAAIAPHRCPAIIFVRSDEISQQLLNHQRLIAPFPAEYAYPQP